MNKILCSPITKPTVLFIGFMAAVSVIRNLSRTFNYYLQDTVIGWLKMDLAVSLLLYALCVVLFIFSIWQSESNKNLPAWRNIDAALLFVLTYGIVLLCVYYVRYGVRTFLFADYRLQIMFLSAAAYIVVMMLLAEAVARIRDRKLKQTLYWLRFFNQYSIRHPLGFMMAFILCGHLFYLFILCPDRAMSTDLNAIMLFISIFTLITLTYFCTFLLSLSTEYDKANVEKIRAERFKSELITNVSHDIRTPLTSIINYLDLLKTLPVENTEFTEYVGILDRKAIRLKTLINDLMEASKASTGNMNVNIQEINLAEMVGQIAGEFDDPFNERDLTIVFHQPENSVLVQADSGHLWRTLENLFGNAAKYAMPGTRVFIEIVSRDSNSIVRLKNTSQNHIDLPGDALTEQFIRVDRARQTEGSGLGLYIAKSLVELMGGLFSIRVMGDLFEVEIMLPQK